MDLLPSFLKNRQQYAAFVSDLLLTREKDNKALERDLQHVFTAVSMDEEFGSHATKNDPDACLYEQVKECHSRLSTQLQCDRMLPVCT